MPAIAISGGRQRRRLVLAGSFVLATILLPMYHLWLRISSHQYHQVATLIAVGKERQALSLPAEYSFIPAETPFCAKRFGTAFLHNLRDSATQYCNQSSDLTCFHTRTVSDRWDSFCFGKGAKFDRNTGKFHLHCNLGQNAEADLNQTVFEKAPGFPSFDKLEKYWYDTGTPHVFNGWVQMDNETQTSSTKTGNYTILVKREGSTNHWHSLMEIYSMTLSMDVLQITPISPGSTPFYIAERDSPNTQVVIVDDHPDGPYIDMWSLFTAKPILRFNDLPENTTFENLIVPLAGAGNTLWQGDWEVNSCEKSTLLNTFVDRALTLYGLNDTKPRQSENITLTFINRVSGRRLVNQTQYLERLEREFPLVNVQSIDFAGISYRDQLKIIQESDILAGVHGAGLTHGIFLPPRSAMVEILPPGLNHKGFRNVASLRGHDYFSIHASDPRLTHKGDWHSEDVYLDIERFMDVMNIAIKVMYNKGLRSYDVR
jgi:protein O-GlcNAc transferase